MADITGNPAPLNVPAPQDANGTLTPRQGNAANGIPVEPAVSAPVTVSSAVTYPNAVDVMPPPAVPDMPYEVGSLPIVITPVDASLLSGDTLQYTATRSGVDVTALVAWTSSDDTLATFSPDGAGGGLATGHGGGGDVTIYAKLNGVVGSTGLTVTNV